MDYTYPGYYKLLGGKLVIILNGVTIYDYIFSNNSQNLTLTPLFNDPNLIQWTNNQTMNLTRYIDEREDSADEQIFDTNLLPKFYGSWATKISDAIDERNHIDRYNESILITFYPNGFFSGMINRTGSSRWKDDPPSKWYHYNHTYPVAGYYEIRGKKLVLTTSGVGIFYFIFTNNFCTLSLVPINIKNPTINHFLNYYISQTLLLKKQSESIQQNFKDQSLEDNITNKLVGTWTASRVINESEYNGKKNYTLMFFSEQFFLLFFNSTYTIKQQYFTDNHSVIYHYYNSNNSYIYQGYYEVKAGKLVIITDTVNILNFTFSNNSDTLTLRPVFSQPISFWEEIQIFTKN
jgi:hypothetical protein